ncbi:dethiobiotin synthase [Clostridiaceae bacterium]|nr:dethiobiotin synthase [Clostridiaceae bacterium]RKI10928.1 dethiobiotin synthase [bacterium 1XD21-70]
MSKRNSGKPCRTLFITGTGTDVGKTYVTGLILKKLHENGNSAAYYKAAMSGNDRREDGTLIPGDAMIVREVAGIRQPLEEMCPYVYENAVSPHLASRIEGNPVEMEQVRKGFEALCEQYEYVTVEGSGGILCPIGMDEEEIWLEDVIQSCHMGCVMVADAGLGTINSVGLTAFYMKQKGIPLRGIIFNHYEPGNVLHEDNRRMCEHLTGVKVVACVRDKDQELRIGLEQLQDLYHGRDPQLR